MATIAALVYNPVNGIRAIRARELLREASKVHTVKHIYRESNNAVDFLRYAHFLFRTKPDLIFCMDIGIGPFYAIKAYKMLSGKKPYVIQETADLVADLMELFDVSSPFVRNKVRKLEERALQAADAIQVSSITHKDLLEKKGFQHIAYVPDCADFSRFFPKENRMLRKKLGISQTLTIGCAGSLTYSKKHDFVPFGSAVIDTIKNLKGLPVRAVIVGDGSGLEPLRQKAKEAGISDQVIFTGKIPFEEMPDYLNCIDICIHAVPNIDCFKIITSQKMPEYFATNRFIIASEEGEAGRLVKEFGVVLEYTGVYDSSFGDKAATIIRRILKQKNILMSASQERVFAEKHFDYAKVSRKMLERINAALEKSIHTSGKE